ncbi:Ig-like domain-containing protein [Planctomyces sp. SH-PL62]|uniref:Ig-like domain-containing protein n=1 Tax=Planctomyces sp. SH-PL62 TaxID=1636152 RepID=UPI00078D6CF0|nr:Ig-like domain-containing protein [Planctomyces sp. SH-PL62]AMV37293.1 hypothetical protein VT85_07660 [Planctomyces sp. SH-PL62]
MHSGHDGSNDSASAAATSARRSGGRGRRSRRFRPTAERVERRELLAAFGLVAHGVVERVALPRAIPALDPSSTISVTGLDVSTKAGGLFNGVVATFQSSDPEARAADFTATIDWGPGTTTNAVVRAADGGEFEVVGAYSYSGPGSYAIRTTVSGGTGISGASLATATIAAQPIEVVALAITAEPGGLFNDTVATFKSTAPPAEVQAGNFTALIDWGDGTTQEAVVQPAGDSGFQVLGFHTYPVAGSYPVTTTVVDHVRNTSARVLATATIGTPSISLTASSFAAQPGVPATPAVARFTSTAPGAKAADFTATIDWGDGTAQTNGVVQEVEGGSFEVKDTHTYAVAGEFPVRVTIEDGIRKQTVVSLATAGVGRLVAPLTGGLAPSSDSGVSGSDGVTNVSRPTFLGSSTPWAVVQLYAVRASSWPTETRLLGQAIAGGDGTWSLTSAFLPDGVYSVTAVQTPSKGSPSQPVVLVDSLTIDTIGPRVHGLAFNPKNGTITTVISDVGAGLDESSAQDPTNYTVIPPSTIIGVHPGRGGGQNPFQSPAISGFYSDASAYTIQLDFGGGEGRRWSRGRYMFQVRSGGVVDRAGNALDGEFTGALPSGDGVPGGNFIAKLINNQKARPQPRRAAPPRFAGRG